MKLVVFDIDGTLSDSGHRVHHLSKQPKDWDAFFAGMDSDPPNEPMVELCRALHGQGHRIVLCTGRYEKHREVTEQWLTRNAIPYHEIRMRKDGDKRPDTKVKSEMISSGEKNRILFVVEDRARVAQMWRNMGLVCLQCAKGDF